MKREIGEDFNSYKERLKEDKRKAKEHLKGTLKVPMNPSARKSRKK
jgi:hypothetical protein